MGRLDAPKNASRKKSATRRGALACRNVAERKVGLQIFHRLAIRFRVRVDKIVQRIASLIGRETDVAAVGEENAVGVVRAKEIVALGGILPGFGGVDWDPAIPAR